MKKINFIAALVTLLAAFIISSNASAVVITAGGGSQDFTVDLGGNVSGTDLAGLSGSANFSLDSVSGNTWVFNVDLFNTTDTSLFQSATISLLGFAVDPNIASGSVSGIFDNFRFGSINANGGIATEFCVKDGVSQGCNGSAKGLAIGENGSFTLSLTFASAISSITMSDFGIRWQALESDQYGIQGGSGTGTSTVTVPAPGALALLGLGLLGMGISRKLKKA